MAGGIWQYKMDGPSTSFMYWHTTTEESKIPANAIARRFLQDEDVVPEACFVNGNATRVEARVNLSMLPADVKSGLADYVGALPVILRVAR